MHSVLVRSSPATSRPATPSSPAGRMAERARLALSEPHGWASKPWHPRDFPVSVPVETENMFSDAVWSVRTFGECCVECLDLSVLNLNPELANEIHWFAMESIATARTNAYTVDINPSAPILFVFFIYGFDCCSVNLLGLST
jgi:hypothetical protein